jgi:two-component system, NtrC family, nitrogen regulation response regulator NtrX
MLDTAPNGSAAHGMLGAAFAGLALREAREMFEREYLVAQINRFGGNISRTANFVGMERSALHRKLKSLNVIAAGRSERVEEVEAHA